MAWEKTNCYLCDKEAEELDFPGSLRVRCSECKAFYALSYKVQFFRIDKKTKQLLYENAITQIKTPLSDIQKQNLLKYIKENQDPKEKEPVMITLKILDDLKKGGQ